MLKSQMVRSALVFSKTNFPRIVRCPLIVSLLLFAVTTVLMTSAPVLADQVEGVAFVGKPFGVGKITTEIKGNHQLPSGPLFLIANNGRAIYPAYARTESYQINGNRGATFPFRLTVYFLFDGETPLNLVLRSKEIRTAVVTPTKNGAGHAALLKQWWHFYHAAAHSAAKADAYPPIVENYLTTTLARRLKLRRSDLPKYWSPWDSWKGLDAMIAQLSGAESVRLAAQTRILLDDTSEQEVADQPLSEGVAIPQIELPELHGEIDIEPIARHVPVECFYVRCGSYENFRWLRDTIDRFGTRARDLRAVRGLDYKLNVRLERQLALKETLLAKLFGGQIISDVAILGSDMLLRQGATIGILFEAHNSPELRQQITAMRNDARESEQGAKSKTITMLGHNVDFLSTPGNRIRSYYATDGKYHLVTTSRTIVQRFFEAGLGKNSLADSQEFRWARSKMPLENDYTTFIYLSDPFFRQLISPRYRIEMTRRNEAASAIDVVRLARLAAKMEGHASDSIEELIEAKLLPAGFSKRPDKSYVVTADGQLTDSLRGEYGSFLPVADVEIERATPSEIKAYQKFSEAYSRLWKRMDPVVVGIGRQMLEEKEGRNKHLQKTERITLDIKITPYARDRFNWVARFLKPPDEYHWTPLPDDIISLSFGINIFELGWIVVGMRDHEPQFSVVDGKIEHVNYSFIPPFIYFAGKARKDVAEINLPFLGLSREPPDKQGNIRIKSHIFSEGESWARKLPGIVIVSHSKQTLAEMAPHAKFVETERDAQVRVEVADLANRKVASLLNAECYLRSRRTSIGNADFMNILIQQLQVPAQDARDVAERLLGAELVCPLGGKYIIPKVRKGSHREQDFWQSTTFKSSTPITKKGIPQLYQDPLLKWFAGLSLELSFDETTLTTHIEVDVRSE